MECETRDSSSSDELEHSEDEKEIQQELEDLLEASEMLNDIYTPSMIERLKNLEIFLPFEVPESHLIEHRFDRPASQYVEERFQQLGVEMKSGYFDPEEDEILQRNWESFSETYHFDDPQIFFSHKYLHQRQKAKFLQYIGYGLPNRRLYSIFTRFRNLFRIKSTGRFTKHEDKLIKHYVEKKGKHKYKELSKLLGRDRMSIYRRCILLHQTGEIPEKIVWTYEKVEEMVRLLVTVCGVENVKEFHGHVNIDHKFWNIVAIRMSLPKDRLVRFWKFKLYTQIFATRPITRNALCIHAINWLRKAKIKYWQNVRWNAIGKDFDEGVTGPFIVEIIHNLIRDRVPKHCWSTARDTVRYLREVLPLIKNRRDRRLQRLWFDEECKLHLVDDQEDCDTNVC